MNWLYYLLEANLYLAVFYAFYRLFLHQETFYSINRYYLIIATLISFTLPFLQVGYINSFFPAPEIQVSVTSQTPAIPAGNFELTTILFGIYLLITCGFLVKMMLSLSRIFTIFFKAKRKKVAKVTHVELEGSHTAFSFFNILFINPNLSRKDTVLEHEMVHINQHHTMDVLFFEFVQIISWFNPITYFIKEDIKLVHEYIADELTTSVSIKKHDYALFIIENSFGVIPNQLSNQIFNHSLIKRRIKMLNKQKSGGLAKLRFLLLVPLTGGLLFTSTMAFSKEYVLFDLLPQDNLVVQNILQDGSKQDKTKKVSPPPPPAEPKMIKFAKPKKQDPRFPPPIIKNDQTGNRNIKFPPPIVRPNQPKKPSIPPPPPPAEPNGKNEVIKGEPAPLKEIEIIEGVPAENTSGSGSAMIAKRNSDGGNSINKIKIALTEQAKDGTLNAVSTKSNGTTFKATPQYRIFTPLPSQIKVKEPALTGVKITGKAKSTANN